MGNSQTIGGDRLGAGKKMKAYLRSYERSNHDLSYMWKSTMSVGTLVPFMSEVALPGDNFKINLDANVRTIPTNGPLFGSFKVQLDVFQVPIRLFIKELHNNALNVGMNMSSIALPQVRLKAQRPQIIDEDYFIDNKQIEPSSIFSYLNIRGLGTTDSDLILYRDFNALPWLSYNSIYKNYYANKQEEIGAIIHTYSLSLPQNITAVRSWNGGQLFNDSTVDGDTQIWDWGTWASAQTGIRISNGGNLIDWSRVEIVISFNSGNDIKRGFVTDYGFTRIDIGSNTYTIEFPESWQEQTPDWIDVFYYNNANAGNEPQIQTFDLNGIDEMRNYLLENSAVVIDEDIDIYPYNLVLFNNQETSFPDFEASYNYSQEGLFLKTYQSDLFNNWLNTEWIDGDNGINELTRVEVNEEGFLIDDLNIMTKVYYMLNRIAISDGSYKSWLETVYDYNISNWNVESPVYLGGLSKELTFDEVISTADVNNTDVDQPLGTLGGRGIMTKKHKGGYIDVKIDEPSYIMGIISLTPRIDYSQGNKWDMSLQTMDDFHKPQLDQIGFQEFSFDQAAWFSTKLQPAGAYQVVSAGKQPAWLNYMTNVNQVRGNFAKDGDGGEMFMTLNRKYEVGQSNSGEVQGVQDLTTYIDPVKYNDIFSYGKIDAQNFWTQIKVDINARRKMSAKIMPNL